MKRCNKCGETKDEAEFYLVTQRGRTQLRAICKACFRAQQKDRSGEPKPEGRICTQCGEYKALAQFHKHKTAPFGVEPMCKTGRLRKRREYSRKFPERVRNSDLKEKYGITLADYRELLRKQHGRCAICGTSEEKLVVDHNHTTGQMRGPLYHLCNAMIGCARESIAILTQAAGYPYAETHLHTGPVHAQIAFVGAGAL